MLLFEQRARLDENACDALVQGGIDATIARFLCMRGIKTPQEAEAFLHPALEKLHSPFLFKSMEKVVLRLKRAVAEKEKVVIYGDYDADGVTATAVLMAYFKEIGMDVSYYIPDRHGEGYGLNVAAVETLAKQYKLMITVDCGITSVAEVALAKKTGLDVIVTDHHSPLDELPDAPIINPRLDGYPFPYLAGVGVALKIVQAMGGLEALERYLDIAAIGTVADIVPLVDENRIIVKHGLEKIARGPRPGIKAIMDNAGIQGSTINSVHIGFLIGPRINAGGRIGHSAKSVEMMIAAEYDKAKQIADTLEQHNQMRQAQELKIMEEALLQIEKQVNLVEDRAIVVCGEEWNPGVVGIVASRLVERFNRPAFVMARQEDSYVCSARSLKGIGLFEVLNQMPELFERYGGHEMAAGLTIQKDKLPEFKKRLLQLLSDMPDDPWIPVVQYDVKAPLSLFTLELMESLSCLEPFGQGNQSPVYLVEGVRVRGASTMGANGNHLKLTLAEGNQIMEAAAFKMGDRLSEASALIDVAVTAEKNVWQGKTSVRLLVKQFSPSVSGFMEHARENGKKALAGYLPYALRDKEIGFKRHLGAKPADALRLLRQSLYGTLLLYTLDDTLEGFMQLFAQEGVLHRLNLGVGLKREGELPYNHICSFDLIEPGAMAMYSNIVLLDGCLDKAVVDALLESAGQVLVFTMERNEELRERVLSSAPDVQELRAFYRGLRALGTRLSGIRDMQGLQVAVSEFSQLELPAIQVALMMLEDMQLVGVERRPFMVSLAQQIDGKRSFEETKTQKKILELQDLV